MKKLWDMSRLVEEFGYLGSKCQHVFQSKRARTTLNAQTSTSLLRDTAPANTFVRGKSGYLPFRPGGLDEVVIPEDPPTTVSRHQGGDASSFR